jgi:replicative DNA helicase
MPPKRKKTDFVEAEQAQKIQPYNPEAEAAILGAILIDPERTLDLCSNEDITEESFYIHAHKLIYGVAHDLYAKGLPVDPVTISDELQRVGKLDEIGGIATLEHLAERTMSVGYSAHYVEILHDNELLRRIIDVALSAETKCYSRDRSTDLILSETEQAVLSISDKQKDKTPSWAASVSTTFDHLNILMSHTDGLNGLSTGLTDLDNRMQGLRPAEMIVLAARPSMGKTSKKTPLFSLLDVFSTTVVVLSYIFMYGYI